MHQECFVSFDRKTVIDVIDGGGRGRFTGQSLDEIRARYPDALQMDIDKAADAIEQLYCSKHPTPITEHAFLAALEELPPVEWHTNANSESFKSPEALSGRVTSIYVRIGQQFYQFYERFGMKHRDIVAFVDRNN